MNLSEFTFRIILLFIPGLLTFKIVDALTHHKETKPYKILLDSLLYGFICYFCLYPLSLFSCFKIDFSFFEVIGDNSKKLDFEVIAIASIFSFPIGLCIATFSNHGCLHWFAQKFNITKKFSDIDVWSHLLNSRIPEWVIIRDMKYNLMYEGWINAFSDGTEPDELFLRDVKVFDNTTGKEIYETPGIYLARAREDLIIEFPLIAYTKFRDRPIKKEESNG